MSRTFFGAGEYTLALPEADSLKAKRALLNRAKARLQKDLGVSVAEVDEQDTWQRAVLGVAVVASTESGVDRVLDRVVAVIERDPRVEVLSSEAIVDVLD